MLSGVTVIGFIGYLLLGLSAFDAIYMTVITITTVGFSEIGAPEEITGAYQAFTLLLALFGVGTALYTLGVSFEALVEGSINDGLQIRRGLRMIDKKSNHIIVVGNGRAGAINAALLAASIIGLQQPAVAQALDDFRQAQTDRVLGDPDPALEPLAS